MIPIAEARVVRPSKEAIANVRRDRSTGQDHSEPIGDVQVSYFQRHPDDDEDETSHGRDYGSGARLVSADLASPFPRL